MRSYLVAFAVTAALVLGAGARAQGIPPETLPPGAGFVWERVGDRGVNASDLTFSPDGALWSAGTRFHRLAPPVGPSAVWEERSTLIRSAVLVLPSSNPGTVPDTVLISDSRGVLRSLDGGYTFTDTGGDGDEEIIAGGPGGMLLAATNDANGIWRSADRGATWTPGSYPPPLPTQNDADAVLALPPGPGWSTWRVIAGGRNGVTVSSDTARTFHRASLWASNTYRVSRLAVVEGPGGGVRVLAGGAVNAQPYARVWASDDGGETWAAVGMLDDVADAGNGYAVFRALVPLGGRSALALMGRGTIHRSDDGGQTWAVVGRAALDVPEDEDARSAELGPDGRLYVGLFRVGERAFVYRTVSPVVSAEPAPAPEDSGLTLRAEPNPSSGTVALILSLGAAEARVRVVVYDSLGREVAVAHEGALGAGEHRLPLNTRELAPGAYVARVTAGGAAATARLALTR